MKLHKVEGVHGQWLFLSPGNADVKIADVLVLPSGERVHVYNVKHINQYVVRCEVARGFGGSTKDEQEPGPVERIPHRYHV